MITRAERIGALRQGEKLIFTYENLGCNLPTLRSSLYQIGQRAGAKYSMRTIGDEIHVLCVRLQKMQTGE